MGRNRLEGEITSLSPSLSNEDWIICRCSPFTHQGVTIKQIAVVRRYKNPTNIADELLKGARIPVNLLFDPSGRALTAETVMQGLSKASQRQKPFDFLAGSVWLT